MDTLPDTFDADAIRAASELLAIARSVCHEPRSPIVVRPVTAVRVVVRRHVAIRLHAARSARAVSARNRTIAALSSSVRSASSTFMGGILLSLKTKRQLGRANLARAVARAAREHGRASLSLGYAYGHAGSITNQTRPMAEAFSCGSRPDVGVPVVR
jgi:hypothetical protein